VFIHTFCAQLEMFPQVIEQLDTTQVEVITIDLPGHGESSAPPADYTAGYLTDTVEGLFAHLDLHKAVFGQSTGASIGLILAARGRSSHRPRRGGQPLSLRPLSRRARARASCRRTSVTSSPRRSRPS